LGWATNKTGTEISTEVFVSIFVFILSPLLGRPQWQWEIVINPRVYQLEATHSQQSGFPGLDLRTPIV
jgi:hypothetical protein